VIVQELLTRLGFTVNSSQLNAYNSQVQNMAKTAITVGAGIATTLMGGLIKVSAETFGNFESKLQQTAAVSGATREEMAKMEEQALSLGSSTKFSASEAADAQGELSKSGFNVNQVLSATPGILSLAAAGGLAVGKAAEIASGSINAFGLSADQAGMVSDLFAMGANKSAIGIEDLGETAKYAAPAFRGAGQSIQDFTTLTAIMGNNMIKGSMAGTALAGGMSRLVSPPSEAAKALKKYNIITHDSKGNMLNIVDIAVQMKDKLKNLTQQQKSAALTAIFGMEASKGWNAVLNTSEKDIRAMQKSMHNNTGAAKEMSDVMNSGLLPTLDAMKGSIETLAIRIGKQLSPYLQKLANIIGDVANYLSDLDPEIHKIIAQLMILTSVVGASILAFMLYKTVKPYITSLAKEIWALILKINLIHVSLFIGIIALALFLNDLYTFANGGDSIIGRFLAPFPKIKQTLLNIIESVKSMYNYMMTAFKDLGLALQSAFGGSGQILEYVIYALLGIGAVIASVIGFFVLGSAAIILALGYIVSYIPSAFSQAFEFVKFIFSSFGQFLVAVFEIMYYNITSKITIIKESFFTFVQQVKGFFINLFTVEIPGIFNSFISSVGQIIVDIENLFSNLISNIVSFFSNAFTNVIPSLISGIGNSITSMADSLSDMVQTATGFKMPSFAGGGGTNITNNTNVRVGGSNSPASEIAGKTGGRILQSTQKALASAANNKRGIVR